jgi:hypothetical protein
MAADITPWLDILEELRALHIRKAADYGADADAYANVRASAAFGVPAWVGVAIRMNDKMIRLQSFARKGELENESAEDSLLDIAVYAVIALMLMREEKQRALDGR